MGFLSRGSLLTLIWASATLATPLFAEPLENLDLEIRQTNSKCPTSYTSRNGLNFTTYCEKNNPFNDALEPFEVGSMQECMERCSRYWGKNEETGMSEGCFGVVWREDGQCWMRNSTTGTANMVDDTGIHAALVDSQDMKGLKEDCPADDLSTHDVQGMEGIGYTVHCGKVIGGFDTCFDGYPSCNESPWIGFYHATSLGDCIRYCIAEHPLCKGVSYNPGLEIGFANCWPKTGFPNNLGDPPSDMGVLHSATITNIDTVDSKCPEKNSYSTTDNKNFEIHCDKLNSGTNITAIHTQNITACMDACATNDKGCVGIVYDSSLANGYNNCYLQNTTSTITDKTSVSYAILAGSSIPTSSSTSTPNSSNGDGSSDSSSSSSKAWIAGPVIGGIAGIAIIAGAIFWWRRRKNKGSPNALEKDGNPYAPAPAYSPYGGAAAGGIHEYRDAPPSELGGDHAREMPTNEYKPTTKYAHAQEGRQGAQELPT